MNWRDKLYKKYPEMLKCPIDCGDGWKKIIEDLCREVNKANKDLIVVQIKEKFGTLRFYTTYETDEVFELIRKAEKLSESTCENCGKEGKTQQIRGWYFTACENCRQKLEKGKL